jgi:hypothetical protein
LVETKNYIISKQKSQNFMKKQKENSLIMMQRPVMTLKSREMAEKKIESLKQELGEV